METVFSKSNALPATSAPHIQQTYPALELETRTHVGTDQAAYYCLRRPQTMRAWQNLQPLGVPRAEKINGRLAWKISDIRTFLNGGK